MLKNILSKYHTWIVVGVAAALAAAQVLLAMPVPDYVYSFLGSLGIVSVRTTFIQTAGVGGWKTYALAFGEAAVAACRAAGLDVPYEVDGVLVALAGGTMTSAMKKA